MKYLFKVALFLFPIFSLLEGKELAHPNHPEIQIDLESPDFVKDLGEGKLKIWIIAKGTRSEGLHGRLEGLDNPSEKITSIQTSSGKIVYRGDWTDRPFLWAVSGWLPEDLDAPFLREEKIDYSIGPLDLATAVETTLKTIVEIQDKQIDRGAEEHSIGYSYSLTAGAIVFSLSEDAGLIYSSYTTYEIVFPESRSKWARPKDRSVLIVRSYTQSEKTKIEELDLLSYRLRQVKEGISSR